MEFGYARISAKSQNVDRQRIALMSFGIPETAIYIDVQSGKDFQRPAYQLLLNTISENDLLVVESIDRLGRNYEEILIEWRKITQEKRANIVVIDMPLLDTRIKENDITGKLISDIVLQLLAYVSEIERKNIRQRQKEGIYAARQRGVVLGRPPLIPPNNYASIKELWDNKKITTKEAARLLQVDKKTFLKWSRN